METETEWRGTRFGERRIGERFQTNESPLGWRVPFKAGKPKRERLRRKPAPQCRFIDVSVTGAKLLAPEAKDLHVGSQTLIEYNGEPTSVKIRRVEPYSQTFSLYGVSFVELGPRVKDVIYAVDGIRARRHGDPLDHQHSATAAS